MHYLTVNGVQVEAVRIKEFDNEPFECAESMVPFIKQCLQDKILEVYDKGCTAYARWAVRNDSGEIVGLGEPGDYLVRSKNTLTVVRRDVFELCFRKVEAISDPIHTTNLCPEIARAKPLLEVEVRGTVNSGKSLIAAMIKRFLKSQGFNNINLVNLERGASLTLDVRAQDFMAGHRPRYELEFLDTQINIFDNCKHPENK